MRRVIQNNRSYLLDLVLCIMVAVLILMHQRQATRIDELWKELDAQRAWLHKLDTGVTVDTDGARTTVERVR